MGTDRIEKKIVLRAARKRVWRALADSTEFGSWFGMKMDGAFRTGAVMRCVLTPTKVNAEVATLQKPHEGMAFEITIEKMESERLFSFRWHPHAVGPGADFSGEPATLVELVLAETADGVLLTVTESGFEGIPLARRAKAFTANEGGWSITIKVFEEYLILAP